MPSDEFPLDLDAVDDEVERLNEHHEAMHSRGILADFAIYSAALFVGGSGLVNAQTTLSALTTTALVQLVGIPLLGGAAATAFMRWRARRHGYLTDAERYSYNWPWSNGKFTLYEGGIRVPAAMRWVGTLPAGSSCTQMAITMDWTATMVAAAGGSTEALDGIDLLPCARGGAPSDRTLFWRQPDPVQAPHAAARRAQWKYLRVGADEFLYDVTVDPGEKADLKPGHPTVLAELRDAWNRWNAQMVPMRRETTPP